MFCLVLVGLLVCWWLPPNEPAYKGKKLSVWLDELQALPQADQANPRTPQVQAVRAIGTNAIPWLIQEMGRHPTAGWRWRVNQVLEKQKLIGYRLPYRNHPFRAEVGFRALGEVGEPAIPAILAFVEKYPDIVPRTLAAIGRPAIPALQNCLTNTRPSTNSFGTPGNLLPANTISAVFGAGQAGSLTFSDIKILIPSIKGWAQQSTNRWAKQNAAFVLGQIGQQE